MPMGTQEIVSGTLRINEYGFVLDLPHGAFWGLEFGSLRTAQRYLNTAVTVEGTRIGFNVLAVDRIWPQGTPKPKHWTERLRIRLAHIKAYILKNKR